MVLSRGEVGDVPDSASYGIFLSYRREDATPYARLLQSELTERFPDAPVFMDLDSIELGLDFAEVIERGLLDPGDGRRLRAEAQDAVRRIAEREPPFDRDWFGWRPHPAWPPPTLPEGWDRV